MSGHHVDVVVVGGGPTGMTAAGDLARSGRSVIVLERRATINPSSRAFATMARTLEMLDARGLADDLLAQAYRAPGVTIFGGAQIDLTHLDSPYQFVMITPQTNVDQALAGYAVAHGADVRRGIEVVGLDQDADGIDRDSATARRGRRIALASHVFDRCRRRAQHGPRAGGRGLPGPDHPVLDCARRCQTRTWAFGRRPDAGQHA